MANQNEIENLDQMPLNPIEDKLSKLGEAAKNSINIHPQNYSKQESKRAELTCIEPIKLGKIK